MAGTKGDYQLYRRRTTKTKNGKPIYAYYYRIWEGDKRSVGKTTRQTSKTAARAWVQARLKTGTLRSGVDQRLRDYCADWWNPEERYLQKKQRKISVHWSFQPIVIKQTK
jgi:hypothetical protein